MNAKRLVLATSIFAVTLVLVATAFYFSMPSPDVTKANFTRLRVGMNKDEVESIFSAVPVKGGRIRIRALELHVHMRIANNTHVGHVYEGRNGIAIVTFNSLNRVTGLEWYDESNYFVKRFFR